MRRDMFIHPRFLCRQLGVGRSFLFSSFSELWITLISHGDYVL
jgi:hypothetical protein